MDIERVLRVTHAKYKCACGAESEAFLNTVPMREHWLKCECKRMVWPYTISLLERRATWWGDRIDAGFFDFGIDGTGTS